MRFLYNEDCLTFELYGIVCIYEIVVLVSGVGRMVAWVHCILGIGWRGVGWCWLNNGVKGVGWVRMGRQGVGRGRHRQEHNYA